MGEIEFKGELHTIPAGAALVLAVDRHLTGEQAEQIKRHVHEALPGREVLVVGPGVTVSALERLPVVNMDMASGPDMTAVAAVSPQTGSITIINRTSERLDPEALAAAMISERVVAAMGAQFVHRQRTETSYSASGPGHRDIGEDPMEAARALVKKHGGGSGG